MFVVHTATGCYGQESFCYSGIDTADGLLRIRDIEGFCDISHSYPPLKRNSLDKKPLKRVL